MPDEDLAVHVAETADERAWHVLFERSYSYLHRYALSLGQGLDGSDDLVQETLMKAWNHRDRYDPAYPYRGWLRTILRRLATTEHRRGQAFQHAVETARGRGLDAEWHGAPPLDASERMARIEQRERVLPVLQMLSEEDQGILMAWAEGATGRDLAEVMEILPSTARGRLMRAKDRLVALYATVYEDFRG